MSAHSCCLLRRAQHWTPGSRSILPNGNRPKRISGRAKPSSSKRSRSVRPAAGTGMLKREEHWSAEHFRLFGYDPATTQPSYPVFVEPIHPEDRPSIEQTIATAVAEKGQFQVEYR